MFRVATMTALLTTAAFAFQPDPTKEAKEFEKIAGNWVLDVAESRGERVPDDVFKGFRLTINKDGTFMVRLENDERRGHLKIDPTKSPLTLDIVLETGSDAGKTQPAIYSFETGALTICTGEYNKDRPAAFTTKDKPGTTLLKFKKVK
jgi:uncharacterized protein (TIGR03067 family)